MPEPIISVAHPAPVRHIPKGARLPRIDWYAMRTPIRLRRVDPDALTLVANMVTANDQEGKIFFGFEERTWTLIEQVHYAPAEDGGHDRTKRRVVPEELVAFLEGRDVKSARRTLRDAFRFSPVEPSDAMGFVEADREYDPSLSRDLDFDGRQAAASGLQAWFDANVLTCGGMVLIRTGEPLLCVDSGYHKGWRVHGTPDPHYFPRRFYRLDRQQEAYAVESGLERASRILDTRPNIDAKIRIHDASFFSDDDIRLQANLFPLFVSDAVRLVLNRIKWPDRRDLLTDPAHALDTKLALMDPWHLKAMTGGISLAEAPEAMAAGEAVLRGIHDAAGGLKLLRTHSAVLWGIMERFATYDLPRLQEAGHVAPPTPEDVSALTLL